MFLTFCQHLFLDLLTEIAKKTHNMMKKGEAYLDKEWQTLQLIMQKQKWWKIYSFNIFCIEFIGWSSSMNCVMQCLAHVHICITVYSSDPYFFFTMLDIHKMLILSYNEEGAPISLLNSRHISKVCKCKLY